MVSLEAVVDYSLSVRSQVALPPSPMSVATASTEKPWYEAYPPARCTTPGSINSTELLHALQQGRKPGVDFILVDLRRNDHDVGS